MPKRFTDTDIWDKAWFMKLTAKEKCIVRFIFDKCDPAGIWPMNWALASAYIGEPVSFDDIHNFSYRLDFLPGGKIFVPDFVEFQYGQLSWDCKPHRKVIGILQKYGLYERVLKGYCNPSERVQEEYKEEEKEQEKDEGVVGETITGFPNMPKAEDVGELPEEKINASIELIRITKKQTVTTDQVKAIWGVFKVQNLTGKKYYADVGAVHSHFINWIKTQNFTDANSAQKSVIGNRKSEGADRYKQRKTSQFNAGRAEGD